VRLGKGLVSGLVLVLLTAVSLAAVGLGVSGCSLTEAKDKAALLTALTEFTVKATPLGVTVVSTDKDATVTADGTPVTTAIREGLADVADEWESVVANAGKVDGADAAAAGQAWADLQAAADAVPEGATAGEAGAIIGGPLNDLMAVRDQLRAAALSAD
jgi:hypothetical protein